MGLRTTTIVLSVFCATVLTGCGEAVDPNEPQGFVQTKGSDTIVNAMQETAEEFMKDYPHVFVAVTGGGSGVGIASLINKTTEIATASREMKGKEIEMAEKRGVHPKEIVVAYDGVAVIVNHHNPIDRLPIEALHDIFTGKTTNWRQLGARTCTSSRSLARSVRGPICTSKRWSSSSTRRAAPRSSRKRRSC
jgi:phosphate transport system substrate-binding protein